MSTTRPAQTAVGGTIMPESFRADHVGSLLRPNEVKAARASFREGRLTEQKLHQIEDRAILNALEQQRSIGLDIFTDGEFRRASFQHDLVESLEGFVPSEQPVVERTWQGPGGQPQQQGNRWVVASKLRQVRRLTGLQTDFLKTHASGPIKMTVPSPSQLPPICFQTGLTDQFYPTRSDLLSEFVSIVRAEITALVDDGVSYIQVDAPRYSYYVDPSWRDHLKELGEDPDRTFEEAVSADTSCLEGVRRHGLTVAMHLCRGNNQSKWFAQGGYEPIAEKLFGALPVDRFLLEYDTERAGTFEPLRFVPRDKTVVLGLLSSKDATLETQEELLRRIDEASRYVPVENLALSPQCGFASVAAGNLLSEDDQWRKLELVVETARKVWG